MKKVIHKADTRGHSKYEWLDSYHTFSFDEYFDSNRINFGALRVMTTKWHPEKDSRRIRTRIWKLSPFH